MGYGSVAECQEHITSTEFAEWRAYDEIEPLSSGRRENIFYGTIVATLYNVQRKKRSDTVFHWHDFFPTILETQKKQTVDEQIKIVEMLNMMYGGKDLRGNKPSSA